MNSEDFTQRSAAWIAKQIRAGDLSPVDVVNAAIERIEHLNPSLNAVVIEAFDEARESAVAAEHAVGANRGLGPLHGVPILMKDLLDFKPGWRNTFGGVRALRDFTADYYTTFAERMEKAGAIFLGKTNAPVFGFRGTCDNYMFGPTHNPFDLSRNSGGSSGGSAAAVAAGFVPIAGGGDGGGSIRIPAAWCGVYGYKASFGRVPLRLEPNLFGGTHPFLFEGPITRTVEDAAMVLNAISGSGACDPYSYDSEEDFTQALERPVRGLKIAYSPNLDVYPVQPQVASVVRAAVDALARAGAEVEEIRIGLDAPQRDLSDLWCRLIVPNSVLGLELMKDQGIDVLGKSPEDLPPEFRAWLGRMQDCRVVDYLRDQITRSRIHTVIERVFAEYDFLVTPTLASTAVPNAMDGNTLGPTEINGEAVDPLIGWCLTYLFNLTGHPAASAPAGLAVDGLPVGLQIVGRRNSDASVLALSAALERACPWQPDLDRAQRRLSTQAAMRGAHTGKLLPARQ